jgi:hypothetical protein
MRQLLLLVLALAPVADAAAQESASAPQFQAAARGGFWYGFTVGVGRQYALQSDPCDPGLGPCLERRGVAFGARVGGSVRRSLLWGVEFMKWCWLGDGGCPTGTAENLTFGITWFPLTARGLRVRGGAGIGTVVSQELTTHTDFAMTYALAYDVSISEWLHAAPELLLMCHGSRCNPDYVVLGLAITGY